MLLNKEKHSHLTNTYIYVLLYIKELDILWHSCDTRTNVSWDFYFWNHQNNSSILETEW